MSDKRKILGEHLMPVFEKIGIYPKNIFHGKIDDFENFEVWELTLEEFEKIVGVKVTPVSDDAFEFLDILLDTENNL